MNETQTAGTVRLRNGRELLVSNFSFAGLAVILILFEILTGGRLLGQRNIMNIFNNFFSIGMCALMYSFVMALGELDLSVGAIVGFSSAMAAFVSQVSIYLILPVAVITGLILGLGNGVFTAYLGVESFIGTLAMSFVLRGLTTYFLNGAMGIPIEMRIFDENWIKITALILMAVLAWFIYNRNKFGRYCRAVGASHAAAEQSGIDVRKTRLFAFTLVGLACGFVGFFTLVRACTASSSTGDAFEFDVLLAVLFGGMPLSGGWGVKFRAALIGALAMAALKSGMSLMGIDGLTQQVVQGSSLICVVVISVDRKNVGVIK